MFEIYVEITDNDSPSRLNLKKEVLSDSRAHPCYERNYE